MELGRCRVDGNDDVRGCGGCALGLLLNHARGDGRGGARSGGGGRGGRLVLPARVAGVRAQPQKKPPVSVTQDARRNPEKLYTVGKRQENH